MKIIASIFDSIKLYFIYFKFLTKSWFQYKVDAFLRSLAVFLREAASILVIFLMLQSFDSINGWDFYELLFLFSILFMTYGFLIIFCTGLRDFDHMIHSGDFDRFLLRPRGLLFQIMASNADFFAAIGHGGLGIVLMIISAGNVGIIWNASSILYLMLMIICGVIIQAAIFLFFSSLSFFVIKSDGLKSIMFYNMREIAGYPISIYPKILQGILMFVVPFAFVNYFPAQFFLHNSDMQNYWSGFLYLTPIIAIFMLFGMLVFWRIGLKRYSSAGN